MKSKISPVACAVVLLIAPPISAALHAQPPLPVASPTPDPVERLQAALQAAARDEKKQPEAGAELLTRSSARRVGDFSGYLQFIRDGLMNGDDGTALTYLNQIRSSSNSEEVRNACDAVVALVKKNRADREAAFTARVDDAVKRAGEAVLAAKAPKDLDAILNEFGRLGEARSNRSSDGGMGNALSRIQAAVTFLNRWQDYLFALARDDEQAVANSLRNLAENSGGYSQSPLIPRSEILARMPANHTMTGETREQRRHKPQSEIEAAAEDILDHTQTLADIPAALAKLSALRNEVGESQPSYFNYGTAFSSVQTALQNFEKTRLELESGLGATINLTQNRPDATNQRPGIETRLVTLRAQLILLALPRLLEAPGEKPAAGEGVDVFLRRLIEAAKKRSDWAAVVRGLELTRTLAAGTNGYMSSNNQESDAFKQFFTGLNMEAAEQFQQATIAYLTALKTGVQDLPAPLIGEHLASIQKEHPNEYAAATNYLLNPPASPYQNPPFTARGPYDPRLDPRYNRSSLPTQNEQSITVPAATPTPTPSPKPAATASPALKATPQ